MKTIKLMGMYQNRFTKQVYFVTGTYDDFTWLEYADKWSISDRVKTSDFFNKYEEHYTQQELDFN